MSSPPPPLPPKPVLPPPPPRRTVSATPSPPSSRPTSIWARTRAATTSAWDGAYKISDSVGFWSNRQASKLGAEAFYPTSLELECTKAARILRTFTLDAADLPEESILDQKKTQKVLRKIPPSAIEHAQGLAIFTVLRTGFLISGSGGSGIVLARLNDGSWSAPSGILLHTVGFGFLAGVDVYDVVLILRTQAAVQSFTHPRLSLGGELTVAAGPIGAGHLLETSIDAAPSPVWSYSKSKGAYAGVQLDGQILIERNDENERSYGREVKAEQIFAGEVSPPYWCEGLHQTILAASGKPHDASSIPSGTSPSDLPSSSSLPTSSSSSSIASSGSAGAAARRLPVEALDEEDLVARREMEEAMRSFGIEDPEINLRERREDPLLVVEKQGCPALSLRGGEAAGREEEQEVGGILSELVEGPPEEEEGERRRRSVPPPPPVPPRRTPKVGAAEETAQEGEAREEGTAVEVEEDGEASKRVEVGAEREGGEDSVAQTPEFVDAVEVETEDTVAGEAKQAQEEGEGSGGDEVGEGNHQENGSPRQ